MNVWRPEKIRLGEELPLRRTALKKNCLEEKSGSGKIWLGDG